MKASFSTLTALALCATLGTAALSGCGGGSSNSVPATAPVQTPTNSSNVPIGSLDLKQSASSTAVAVTSSTPAGPTVDIDDRATVALNGTGPAPAVTDSSQHPFKGALRGGASTSSAHRSTKDVAVNSPFDLTNHGGPVLGSAVSHNVFLNCNLACRQAENFDPGHFLADLGKDDFITLLYQYLVGPGVIDSTPLTGRYTKGPGADATVAFKPPLPGDTNPYFGQLDIIIQVFLAAQQPTLGGGGDGHIYHVYLPKNVDTCFEAPFGVPTQSCYSPDNNSTFAFCAYHGAVRINGKIYLYTVEPYQDVPGCRNNVHNQTLPNAVSPTVDPADPGYSTLSHELFETISDPHGNAWFNGFTGNEIGDLCADFDNFVTVNGHRFVLQSEYSDIHHICVSGNLTGDAQTPQQNLFGE